MDFKLYKVGGYVRDKMLGIKSNDIDYTVVASKVNGITTDAIFNTFVDYLKDKGFKIFQIRPEFFTIRARFHDNNEVADFVLARKEIGYKEGTRQPIVVAGNLYDDLYRRDFTINAIAENTEGGIIDYFNGVDDLEKGIIRSVYPDSLKTFIDDPLRILRALRFAHRFNFTLDKNIEQAITDFDISLMKKVSDERIMVELDKMLKTNTLRFFDTLNLLKKLNYDLYNYILTRDFYFKTTTKKKK